MNKQYLKFIGTGSAFNTKLSTTSAYMKYDNSLLLIDCGGPIFERLINMGILDNEIKDINIFITHTHPDHCGSLGDLIFYCHYVLNIKPNIYCVDDNLQTILNYQHVSIEIYNFINLMFNSIITFDKIEIEIIKTKHINDIISSGFIFYINDIHFYYSGDSIEIPEKVMDLIEIGELNYIYQDTCGIDYPNNVHMSLKKLLNIIPDNFKNNVYCMHLDNNIKEEDILLNGFNIVKNEI